MEQTAFPCRPARSRSGSCARRLLVLAAVAAGVVALGAGSALAQTTSPGFAPFARGTLTGMSGSTLQLQGRNGTSSVVVNGSTKYEQTKPATVSDVVAGECIRAAGTGAETTGIHATTISLSKPQGKSGCTVTTERGFGAGRRGQGPNGQGPNGQTFNGPRGSFPQGQTPQGSFPNGGTRPANFGNAFGTVKSVSGDTIVVKAVVVAQPNAQGTAAGAAQSAGAPAKKSTKKQKQATQDVTVTVDGSTVLTQTVGATVKDLASGVCVTANGTVDSVGTVTAKTVTVSQPENGSCTAFGGGFGGRFGPGGTGGPNGGTSGNTT